MATIYEFIVKDKTTKESRMVDADTGEVIARNEVKKSKPFSGSNKGVDHNRYMRAVNPLVNRYVPNFEKSVRAGRAIAGIYDTTLQNGFVNGFTGVGAVVMLELILVKLDDLRREQLEKAKADNLANYNKLITGQTQLSNTINASKNIFGKITFKNQ